MLKQNTLKKEYYFEGKGLHTGKWAKMTLRPSVADSGIVFRRTDLGNAEIPALAENVSNTARSTTISCGEASVVTIEHIMSALTGLGVDNAVIDIDGAEVPILDGSARPYVECISADGVRELDEFRKPVEIDREIYISNEKTGSYIRITPSDHMEIKLKIDFDSRVLGVQTADWDESVDYAKEVAPCRTFVFFHEIEFLAKQGLVKGGDISNAIVIVEHPVTEEQVSSLCELMGIPPLRVTDSGYLNNLDLHFPDECGRHKLLDLIGDIRLAGGWMNARIEAFRPGHTINTNAAKAVRKALNL